MNLQSGEIAVVTTHVPPAKGYGGPSVSIAELAYAWERLGIQVKLVSSDASKGGRLTLSDIALGDKAEIVLYRSYCARRWGFGLGALWKIMRLCFNASVVYINGIATWPTSIAAIICALLRRRYVVALRGGLMPEHVAHIRCHKGLKWWFYKLITFPTLRRALAVHCAGETEAEGARRVVSSELKTIITPNGINLQERRPLAWNDHAGISFAYLGRISSEKGLNGFLQAWLQWRRVEDTMIIAGVGTGTYFEDFLQMLAMPNSGIRYLGEIDKAAVQEVIAASDWVVLPSGLDGEDVRENFGNVVAEALAHARPVLVTQGLNWDHLATEKAGIVFRRNQQGVVIALAQIREMPAKEMRDMGAAARRYAERVLDVDLAAKQVWDALSV